MQIAEFPAHQNADEQQYRKSDPESQCLGHPSGLGWIVGIGLAAFEHEVQGGTEAGEDGRKSGESEVGHGRHYPVSPRSRWVLLTVAAMLGMAATFSLGRWQLSRAAQKESLQAAMEAQHSRAPLSAAALLGGIRLDDVLHRQVHLRGSWIPQRAVFLDNRQMHGQVGFYVVTPLKLADSPAVVLVQRGWVPRNFLDRTQLPQVDSPTGLVEVDGRMAPPPAKLYAFQAAEQGAIRQNLDLAAFTAETGLALLPLSVLQTGPAGDQTSSGLQRDWPPANTGVEKHYGYAFQWFGLCALIAILYVWFQIVRRFFLPPPSRQS